MIDVWYEYKPTLSPWGPPHFIAKLEALGVSTRRVEQLTHSGISMVFASLDTPMVTGLSSKDRTQTVIVDTGARYEDVEQKRQALGLLGLLSSHAWSRWCAGMQSSWGFAGRADVASAAGLVETGNGLSASDGWLNLPALLAQFLLAAERVVGSTKAP